MQIVSPQEKAELERKREELYKSQIDVQERIRKAAALGDLSENAEYHFAKEENRSIQRQLAELEMKLRNCSVVATDNVPEDIVFLGHTVKLLDLDDDSEQLVRIVGEAAPPDTNSDILPVSVNSPMGDALMKARVGDTVKVRAPRGTMEFKILEIVQ
jgi:transcription elongation factor GreA